MKTKATTPDKPPYQIPSMSEISAIPLTGLKSISLFSGCGGSSLGYRMAGFKVLWANEFIPAAAETYRKNYPETLLDTRDIRKLDAKTILKAIKLKTGELDLLDGSPPCASFSTSGIREKNWGKARQYSDTVQRTDDLFFEYARLLKGLMPKVFVAENVSGLVKGVAKGYFIEIFETLQRCGYRVACRVLDAQWLGVPQMRQRTIFIGVRDDLQLDPVHPKPFPYRYSVADALQWTASGPQKKRLMGGIGAAFDSKWEAFNLNEPMPTVITVANQFTVYEPAHELNIEKYAIGKEWDKLKPGQKSSRYFDLGRPHLQRPCFTLLASNGTPGVAGITHPMEKRKMTIDELKRICSFPADFVLTGSYSQQCERLGRAVPPLMMRAIATTIRDQIFNKIQA